MIEIFMGNFMIYHLHLHDWADVKPHVCLQHIIIIFVLQSQS